MNARMFAARVALPVLAAVAVSAQARAADFEWKKFQGKTVTFLANNNPVALALVTYKADFEKLTGMTLKVDGYQEQQMRQRLVTIMNARSDEVDVFMTLPSREGEQFAAAGWYADLSAMSKNEAATEYDLAGLSQALLKAGTFNGKLTSMPMNIEGPILYYRTDILKKCGVEQMENPIFARRRARRRWRPTADCCATMARPASSTTVFSRYRRSIAAAASRCRSNPPMNCAP